MKKLLLLVLAALSLSLVACNSGYEGKPANKDKGSKVSIRFSKVEPNNKQASAADVLWSAYNCLWEKDAKKLFKYVDGYYSADDIYKMKCMMSCKKGIKAGYNSEGFEFAVTDIEVYDDHAIGTVRIKGKIGDSEYDYNQKVDLKKSSSGIWELRRVPRIIDSGVSYRDYNYRYEDSYQEDSYQEDSCKEDSYGEFSAASAPEMYK